MITYDHVWSKPAYPEQGSTRVNGYGGSYRDAIMAFQRDQGMTPTGVVDDATRSKVESAHGH